MTDSNIACNEQVAIARAMHWTINFLYTEHSPGENPGYIEIQMKITTLRQATCDLIALRNTYRNTCL